jgi:hypothetical protein
MAKKDAQVDNLLDALVWMRHKAKKKAAKNKEGQERAPEN